MTLDFNTDQFLTLLTDALRAGPGSPSWHEAMNHLKQQGVEGADEYKLLLEARQNLESGKPYRALKPGPEFTRKVMTAIEEDRGGGGGGGIPTPTLIAIISVLVGLTVFVLIVGLAVRQGSPPQSSVVDLKNRSFARDILSATFDGTLPAGWNRLGSAPVTFWHELRPSNKGGADYQGGGIVTAAGLPADQPIAMEVTLRPGDASDNVITQVFVTDQPDFSPDRATSAHELVWALQVTPGKPKPLFQAQVVLPDGRFAGTGDPIRNGHEDLTLRLLLDANDLVVESGGKSLYAGPHHLDPNKPRYFGIRFLRRGDLQKDQVPGIEVVRIMK